MRIEKDRRQVGTIKRGTSPISQIWNVLRTNSVSITSPLLASFLLFITFFCSSPSWLIIFYLLLFFLLTLEFIYQISLTTLIVFLKILYEKPLSNSFSNASKFKYLLTWRQGLLLHLWVLKDAEFSNLNGSL